MVSPLYSGLSQAVRTWDSEKVYENASVEGMKFKTEADFKKFLKEKNWSSGALL